jgi:hypothetical protein
MIMTLYTRLVRRFRRVARAPQGIGWPERAGLALLATAVLVTAGAWS